MFIKGLQVSDSTFRYTKAPDKDYCSLANYVDPDKMLPCDAF